MGKKIKTDKLGTFANSSSTEKISKDKFKRERN